MSPAEATAPPIPSCGWPTYDQSEKPEGPAALPYLMKTPPLSVSPGEAMFGRVGAPITMSSMPSPLTSPAEAADQPRLAFSMFVERDQLEAGESPSPRPAN